MKLLFRRDLRQETKGMISRSTVTMFLVHARMEVTPAERELIERFALSQRELYAWTPSDIKYKSEEEMRQLTRSITVAGLVQGYDMRFTGFVEMLNAEAAIRKNAEELATIFKMAEKFQKEEVLEF